MPSFDYTIIYEAATKAVTVSSEDFDGGAADHATPVVRTRFPIQLLPAAPPDVSTTTEDAGDVQESSALIIPVRVPLDPQITPDLATTSEDFLGVPDDYSTPIVPTRHPIEPQITPDVSTISEDFLGVPTDHDAPVILTRQPTDPPPAFDLLQEALDTEGAPDDFRAPVIPSRFLFQSVGVPSDVSVTSEDFMGGAAEHGTPLVIRPFAVASPNPMSGVLFSDPVVPPVPPVPGTPSRFGTPEVIVVAQRFLGGEQTILGTRFGIPRVRQGARFGAPRIQTNVARFGSVRLQDVT